MFPTRKSHILDKTIEVVYLTWQINTVKTLLNLVQIKIKIYDCWAFLNMFSDVKKIKKHVFEHVTLSSNLTL
jgi:hypothetical protein